MTKDDILARPEVGQLLHALTLIEDADEAGRLLLDLCTIGEIGDLAQRLEVARLLDAGNSYVAVCEETGLARSCSRRTWRDESVIRRGSPKSIGPERYALSQ